MPRDAELGRELAAAISAADTGRIKTAEFRYDPFLASDGLPEEAQVFILPGAFTHTRLSRAQWGRDCTLNLLMMVDLDVEGTDFEARVDRWLDDFDNMLEVIKSIVINGKAVSHIEQEDRYDIEDLHSNKRLTCTCSIAYKLI